MRFLLISDFACYRNGGANRVVVETCQLLASRGHQLALAYLTPGTPEVDCPATLLPREGQAAALDKLLQEFQPDLVQIHVGLTADGLRTATRGPAAVFCHDQTWICSSGDRMDRHLAPCHHPHGPACLVRHYAIGCGAKSPVRNLIYWRNTARLLAVRDIPHVRLQVASQYMRTGLLENHFAADRIDLVPLYTQPIPHPASLPSEPGLLLLPTRLVPAKGPQVALRALARIRELPWKLVIAGDGWHKAALERLSAELGLTERVTFLGEIAPEALNDWYRRAQVILFPVLRHEPFGLVGVEALAHGRPMVAFGGGGADEWLADNVSALRVSDRNPAAFADAVARLLRDPALSARLAAGAVDRYQHFRPQAYLDRLLASFDRALAHRP